MPAGNWTIAQRKEYLNYYTKNRPIPPTDPKLLGWFAETGRPYANGNSFNAFFKNFFKEAVSNMSAPEQKELKELIGSIDNNIIPQIDIPQRSIVKNYTLDEVNALVEKAGHGRSFKSGRGAFIAAQCVRCHRFGVEGGSIGPDLTSIASRFNRKQIVESIMEPSKVVSDQYANIEIDTKRGILHKGRIVDETKDVVILQKDPLSPDRIEIKTDEITTRDVSKASPMPEQLINVLSVDEIIDLLAYLESAGNPRASMFKK
jgi:putative heme-binding domain-containing protein